MLDHRDLKPHPLTYAPPNKTKKTLPKTPNRKNNCPEKDMKEFLNMITRPVLEGI